jgi:hypothetical protein
MRIMEAEIRLGNRLALLAMCWLYEANLRQSE